MATAEMSPAGPGRAAVEHDALREEGAVDEPIPLFRARLSDTHRVGVLLQLAALQAHAQLRGLRVAEAQGSEPFACAVVDSRGRVAGLRLAERRSDVLTQVSLRRCARMLFSARREVAGRGQARRAVRRLLGLWNDVLVDQPAEQHVRRILRVATFLWDSGHRAHREALLGWHHREDGSTFPWVVGGAAFRERVLSKTDDPQLLRLLLTSDEVAPLWRGRPLETESKVGLSPAELIEGGRWGAALARWKETPPETAAERLLYAECLFHLGQFEDAAEAVQGSDSSRARLLRLRCNLQLGRLQAASRELNRQSWDRLDGERRIQLADAAIRIRANMEDWQEVRDWIRRAAEMQGDRAALGRVIAAVGSWDLLELDEAVQHLCAAVETDSEVVDDWRYQHVLGLVLLRSRGPEDARWAFESALDLGRRDLSVSEAGRLWNEVAMARTLAGDLAAGERGFRHANRLLSRCQGPSRTTLALVNLAEVRIRRGRLEGVGNILEQVRQANALAGNQRGGLADQVLAGRFSLARGRLEEAEALLRDSLDRMGEEARGETLRSEVSLLLARCLGWLGRAEAGRRTLGEAAGTEVGSGADHRILGSLPPGVLEAEEFPALLAQCGLTELVSSCGDAPWTEFWAKALSGGTVTMGDWRKATQDLGAYRSARMVYDALLAGARITEDVRERAMEDLEKLGLDALAGSIAGTLGGSWRAVTDYLRIESPTGEDLRRLFGAAGEAGVRIEVAGRTDTIVLVEGPGGEYLEEVVVGPHRWRVHLEAGGEAARAMAHLVARTCPLQELPGPPDRTVGLPEDVVGQSERLLEAYRALRRLGDSEMPILILGETGTGKERAALAVHEASRRSSGPFLPVNCAAMDENLALSDLFGHIRGAFTGADRDRSGVFESARGGTVFLDEIGDLSPRAQGLLLRVLQEKEVRRLGESRPRPVDVRVVAATHRNLDELVREASFREDLLYRLNTGTVLLPPLRDRGDDVLLLADHFLGQLDPEARLEESARQALLAHDWPGNVRELRSVVERSWAMSGRGRIAEADLPLEANTGPLPGWHEWLQQIKRERLSVELARHDGNQAATARALGLTRQALSYLVRQLGIRRD